MTQYFTSQQIKFIYEQDGEIERIFKARICNVLSEYKKSVRAYLVRASYGSSPTADIKNTSVLLCFCLAGEKDPSLLEVASKIFKTMFRANDHIDIVFFDETKEAKLRTICCPFYTSENFQFPIPDFYLVFKNNTELANPRMCFKRKKLLGINPAGYMLCDIKPEISRQALDFETGTVRQIVLAARQHDVPIFNIKSWPVQVNIGIALCDNLENVDFVDSEKTKLIGNGEIYIST